MRAVVIGGGWACQPAAQLRLGAVTESIVRLFLVTPFDAARLGQAGEVELYRAGLDLLAMLFARTCAESQVPPPPPPPPRPLPCAKRCPSAC